MKEAIDTKIFKRFSTRTIITPIVGCLLLSAIFIFIILQLISANRLVTQSARILRQANENMHLAVSAETAVRGYLLTNDPSYLEPYNLSLLAEEQEFNKLITMTTENIGQTNRAKDMKISFTHWKEYGKKAIALKKANKNVEDILPSQEGKDRMDAFRAIFKRFIEVEELYRDQRNKETKDTINFALYAVFILSSIGGLLIAFVTKNQLTSLSSTYNTILESQFNQNQILEAQEWVQSGKTQLMSEISGDITLEELSDKTLKNICARVEGKVAVFYNAESKKLRRTGAFALSKENHNSLVSFGEGIIGQVALDPKAFLVTDIPDNHLKISSTFIDINPTQIIIIPLLTEQKLEGILEIGFLEKVSPRVLEFLNGVSENIAIAIRSAEYRTSLKNLLEESQRQSEELQAQQEELQANNEELEEQTNALKESQVKLETQQAELEQTNLQLAKQAIELEKQSAEVNIKNHELSLTQNKLEKKAQELEISSQYKSQFLANMSHELRTPLNSTLILSQLLMEDKRHRLGHEEKEFVQTIYSSSNDLLNLINDILDLSKVEAGKIDLLPEEINLQNFATSLERLFRPMADNKKINFKIEISSTTSHFIFLDRQRLEQILKNLISNAIKFTDKGSVTVTINQVAHNRIDFIVNDTGIGIDEDQKDIIFDAFKQADGTTNRKYGGTGLGLTISRDLARLLGGTITLTTQKNKGSTFTLNLPTTQEVHDIENSITLPPNIVIPTKLDRVQTEIKPIHFEDDRDKIADNLKVLLIVEDDTNFAKILYDLGHELNFNCLVSLTAEDGIQMASDYLPHAILLDMNLPDSSGLTVLDSLKRNSKTSHIPIHIISGLDQANMALKMGAIGYLKKPVSLNDVKKAVHKMEEKLAHGLKKVLVVEDNQVQRDSIKALIQDHTVEVQTAENATLALKLLKETSYDCMILDLTLPGMTGYELLEKMTKTDDISSPPVIVYTGKDLSKDEEQRLQKYSQSIILKGAHSPERLFSEVSLFLHQIEEKLPNERQKMLQQLRDREKIFEGKKILLADDDIRNIFSLSAALESKGAIIETARNGKQAIEKIQNDPDIDLVLMDIMMPEMDGYEATREIRKEARFAKLPIIAVTAKAMTDDQEKCREAGANDYLAKPVNLDKLLSLLRVWMPKNGKI